MDKKGFKFLMVIGTAWLFDAMDIALLSFIMPLIKLEWNLSATQLGLASAFTSAGMVIGAFVCGSLADKIGRKKVLILTLSIFSIGNILLTVSPNFIFFLAVRFITGVGLGGELPVATTAVADFFTGTLRSQMLVMADSFWAIGWIIAALLSYYAIPVFGWRATVLMTSVTIVYAFVMREHLPEETKVDEKLAKNKDTFKELWQSEYRLKTMKMAFLWFIVMFTYYGMFLWLPSVLEMRGFSIVKSFGYTLLITLAQLPGYFLATYLMGKIRRKTVLVIYLIGTLFSALAFSQVSSEGLILFTGAMLSFFDLGAWGTMIAFTPDQFPVEIRGTGMGSAHSVGRIGALIGPFIVGVLLDQHFSVSYIWGLFVVVLFIGIVTLIFGIKDEAVDANVEEVKNVA